MDQNASVATAGNGQGEAAVAAPPYHAALHAMAAAGRAPVMGYFALTSEWLGFVHGRINESVVAGTKLAGCRSVDGALAVQMEFTQNAMRACFEEARTLSNLTMKIVSESYAPVTARTPSGGS